MRKPGNWSSYKLVFGASLVIMIVISYGVWQYYHQVGAPNTSSTDSAPNFSLKAVDGTEFSLTQHKGKVIILHFMAVSCGGIEPINEIQLDQLKKVCTKYCSNKTVIIATVAATTCPESTLVNLCVEYGVTWVLGNDYDDGKLDIIDGYKTYSVGDGAIVLIDKALNIAQVYTNTITVDGLSSRINQLLG